MAFGHEIVTVIVGVFVRLTTCRFSRLIRPFASPRSDVGGAGVATGCAAAGSVVVVCFLPSPNILAPVVRVWSWTILHDDAAARRFDATISGSARPSGSWAGGT